MNPTQIAHHEQRVVGAALLNAPTAVGECGHFLAPGDFLNADYGRIWACALKHGVEGRQIDPIIVLGEHPGVPMDTLMAANEAVATAVGCHTHAGIVRTESMRRTALRQYEKHAAELRACEPADVGSVLEGHHAAMAALFAADGGAGVVMGAQALKSWSEQFKERYENKSDVPYLPVGIQALDYVTHGLKRGHSYCLAAGTGDGKTIFGTYTAGFVAEHGDETLYVSAEVPAEDIIERIVAARSLVNGERLATGMTDEGQLHRILAALRSMRQWVDNLTILDKPAPTLADIEREVMAASLNPARKPFRYVVVDYVQLMRHPGAHSRERELNEIGEGLTAIAKRHNLSVLFLSQINGDRHKRTPPKPALQDLRECKGLAQPCTGVFLLWRPERDGVEQYEVNTPTGRRSVDTSGLAVLCVPKNRGGRTGEVVTTLKPEYQTFEAWSANRYPENERF